MHLLQIKIKRDAHVRPFDSGGNARQAQQQPPRLPLPYLASWRSRKNAS
jgi:hypothetical protein